MSSVRFVVGSLLPLMLAGLFCIPSLLAQPKTSTKQPSGQKPGSAPAKPAASPTQSSNEPATVEAAAAVLDLRTFPVMEGAEFRDARRLGMLTYQAKGAPKAAADFQRQKLKALGFAELPGGYNDASSQTASFTKQGYRVNVSAYEVPGDPQRVGWSQVTIVNEGNVALEKLPVPPGSTPFHPNSFRGAYTIDAKVADAANACRKLLLAAGWEPYGSNVSGDSHMHDFKRNAIKLQAWVSTTPAEGGKTLIRYSSELLSADLPAPPSIAQPQYTDSQKTLRFDAPLEETSDIVKFYQQRLPKQGWKATTERPVVDDQKKSRFLIFRNAREELLSLNMQDFKEIVRVSLVHQTAIELAAEEKRAKELAEKAKAELARRNQKIDLNVPLPPAAKEVKKLSENAFEFNVATGSGPATLTALRDHFAKGGWKAGDDEELGENIGSIDLEKEGVRLRLSYFDTGLTDAEIKVAGDKNLVLAPIASKEKPPATSGPKAKPPTNVPGLPPGVELPDDVRDLIEKALKEAGE
jgi:hypothetical protein